MADAGPALAMVDDMRAAMADVGWLTEDVHLHLAEKLMRAAAAIEVEVRTSTSARGVLLVHATVPARHRREVRAIAYRWLANIAEAQTVVRERHSRGGSTYLIATGQPDGPRFAAQGHVIELCLRLAPA
jgi:hypothetical protein